MVEKIYQITEWDIVKNRISGYVNGQYISGRIINRNDDRTIDVETGFNVFRLVLIW